MGLIRVTACLLAFLPSAFVYAQSATILKASRGAIIAGMEAGAQWKQGDAVCIQRDGRTRACGKVARRVGNRAAIRITRAAKGFSFNKGEKVGLVVPPAPAADRGAASASSHTIARKRPLPSDFSVSLGANAGLNYLYPMAHFEYQALDGFTVGAMPLFWYQSGAASQVSGAGGFLTAGYYFGGTAFEGLGVLGGAGAYLFSLAFEELEENAMAFSFFAQLQYRLSLGKSDWQLGAAAGAQFILVETNQIELDFGGIVPMATLTLSYKF